MRNVLSPHVKYDEEYTMQRIWICSRIWYECCAFISYSTHPFQLSAFAAAVHKMYLDASDSVCQCSHSFCNKLMHTYIVDHPEYNTYLYVVLRTLMCQMCRSYLRGSLCILYMHLCIRIPSRMFGFFRAGRNIKITQWNINVSTEMGHTENANEGTRSI